METTAMCSGAHPFIPCPGVGKFTLIYNAVNDQVNNNLEVLHTDLTPWSVAQLSSMASVIANAWAANVAATVSNFVTLANVRATDLTTHTGPSILNTYAAVGSDATEVLPQGCTFAIKKTTGLRGRSYRGRIFHPGLTDRRAFTDQLTTVYGDAILNAWRAVRTAINGVANCQDVVLSQCQGGNWLGTGISTPTSAYDHTDYFIDYQRRRAQGHSRHN